MLQQTEGKMFLAAQRGHSESEGVRSYHTFNFGTYQHPHKGPFGPLLVCNDETLAGGKSLVQFVEADTILLLLPVVGAIRYSDNSGNEMFVKASEVLYRTLRSGTTFEIGNPYEKELVNFIQLRLKTSKHTTYTQPYSFSFDLVQKPNQLLPLIPNDFDKSEATPKLFIGLFNGRQEATYKVAIPGNGLFFFVLRGAFEVQYRLLEARDGLLLQGLEEAELEALSNEAIILLLEMPLA